jgi:hypothetical protein
LRAGAAEVDLGAALGRSRFSLRSSSSTPSSCSSAAMRADIADCLMNSFCAARDTLFSVTTQ